MANFRFYSGIGSKETPEHIQEIMKKIAEILERKKYILRSGGAIGADTAFENGVIMYKEIFYTDDYAVNGGERIPYKKEDLEFADRILKEYHPAFSKGGNGIKNEKSRKLLSRNTFQYFGVGDTINVDFVICYTSDGTESTTTRDTGGTGQAIRIAYDYGTPIYNLKNYIGVSPEEMVDFILKELKEKKG